MNVKRLVLFVIALSTAVSALAGDVILPTFAWNLGGRGLNRWTTEIYLTNPGSSILHVSLEAVYPGKVSVRHPCLPPSPVAWDVPPYTTVPWMARKIWLDVGCPDTMVAGLMLRSESRFVMQSRMVNSPDVPASEALLAGISQEVPGMPVEELPAAGSLYMLPALGWHVAPCGQPALQSYLNVVNPGADIVTLTVQLDAAGSAGDMLVDGRLERVPFAIEIKPASWRQISVAPFPGDPAPACQPVAGLHDLFFQVSGPLAIYGSVVDRSTQDPRTVLFVRMEP
jgi:hypothetical protein